MKKQTIEFSFQIEVIYPDHLSDDYVRERYFSSDRFSILPFKNELGTVSSASTDVISFKVIKL